MSRATARAGERVRRPVGIMNDKLLISRDQALQDYLALGSHRSLRRLHQHYRNRFSQGVPSFWTIRRWAHRHAWVEQARQFDESVRHRTTARSIRERARTETDLVSRFHRVANRSLRAASVGLKEKAETAATAKDLVALVDIAIRASDAADRLMAPLAPEPAHCRGGAIDGARR